MEGDLGGLWGDRGKGLEQLVLKRPDLGGVGGVVDGDLLGPDLLLPALLLQGLQRLWLSGDDQGGGAVYRRQGERICVGLQQLVELSGGDRDAQHAAFACDLRHRLGAGGDDARGV